MLDAFIIRELEKIRERKDREHEGVPLRIYIPEQEEHVPYDDDEEDGKREISDRPSRGPAVPVGGDDNVNTEVDSVRHNVSSFIF